MSSLKKIDFWKKSFGLLPIHLKPTLAEENYVMLNGGYGDFCLQLNDEKSNIEEYYSKAWSTNTKNFVILDNDKLKVLNWTRSSVEEISLGTVTNNLDKFYSYILAKSYKTEKDVVPFIIDIFRQFRNITLEKTNPTDALNLLFVLLTSLEDDYKQFDNDKWNVVKTDIPQNFDFFTDRIRTGITEIKPELDLIIRHSAGVLFQEAQKEVLYFNPQRDLFGGVSSKLQTVNNLYSSIHYTPPYVARTIVENSILKLDLKKDKLKIFDPACGSSEFLIEVLKQLKELNFPGDIEIKGWDSSETAINTSNFLLKYEQRTVWKEKLVFEIRLVDDSLTEKWETDIDLLLMNPPFVSWELSSKSSKEAMRETLDHNLMGKPNQASAFFYKSILSLNADGVIGCIIPSTLLTLDAYKRLRNTIYEIITIDLIGKLGNFVFEDALTDVSLIIAHKPKKDFIPTILWTRNEKGISQTALRELRKMQYSNELTVNKKDYSIYQPSTFPFIKETWKLISFKENEFLKDVERFVLDSKLTRVENIFNVQQGIRQGIKDVFKISEEEFIQFPDAERKNFRPVIDNAAIKEGQLFKSHFIWYPYNKSGMIFNNEEDLEKGSEYFFQSVLLPHKEQLSNRAGITEWWGLTRPRNWQFEKKRKLVSTEFGNSDSFAFDIEGSFVVERGNGWLPKKQFEESDYYFYLTLFSSNLFERLLSIYSKQLAGGNWYDLGKMYTNQIPIPNVHSSNFRNLEAYTMLVSMGKEITLGKSYFKGVADNILTKYFYPEM